MTHFFKKFASCIIIFSLLVVLSACKAVNRKSETSALEEEARWFSDKVNRVYLAFKDTSPNSALSGAAFTEEQKIKIRPLLGIKGFLRNSSGGTDIDRIPGFFLSNSPHFYYPGYYDDDFQNLNIPDSAERDANNFNVIGCFNEPWFDIDKSFYSKVSKLDSDPRPVIDRNKIIGKEVNDELGELSVYGRSQRNFIVPYNSPFAVI